MTSTQEIAHASITDEQLAAIGSFADAVALLESMGAVPVDVDEFGTGFKVVEKATLVDVPFVVLEMRFNDGKFGEEGFVSVTAVTEHGDKVVFNDGSTGIREQARLIVSERTKANIPNPDAGIVARNGLRRSDYFRNEKTGETANTQVDKNYIPATTYYFA